MLRQPPGLCSASRRKSWQREDQPIPRQKFVAPDEDSELLKRLLDGDEHAFAELVDRHHGSLIRLARVYVGDSSVAEEVVQETWLAVLRGLGQFQLRSTLKTWIFRILANKGKTRGAREKRFVPFSALAGTGSRESAVDPSRFTRAGAWAAPPSPWDEETPESLLMNQEAISCVEQSLEGLPPGQRAVVLLRDVEGLDPQEICNILEITETNQRVLLHRGRSKIRRAVEEYFGWKKR